MMHRMFPANFGTRLRAVAGPSGATDLQRNAASFLAALRFFAVAVVVALTAVLESRAHTLSSHPALIGIATWV